MLNTRKIVVGLVIAVGSLIFSAVPASAEPGKGEGIAMAPTVLEDGSSIVTCPETGIKVKFEIQKPTKELEPKWEEQEFSNPGKDLKVVVGWPEGVCSAKGVIEVAKVTVSVCELHLQDTSAESTNEVEALGSSLSACVVKTGVLGCEITVPRGKEAEKVNSNLKKNWLTNVGTENLNVKATDEGITVDPSANCLGVEKSKAGKLKSNILLKGVIHL